MWSLCFQDVPIFVNVSCPAHVRRRSRNLGPSLAFITRCAGFDRVAGATPKAMPFAPDRQLMHDYDGMPAPDDLGTFTRSENREWWQYMLLEENGPRTDKCPLRSRAGNEAQPYFAEVHKCGGRFLTGPENRQVDNLPHLFPNAVNVNWLFSYGRSSNLHFHKREGIWLLNSKILDDRARSGPGGEHGGGFRVAGASRAGPRRGRPVRSLSGLVDRHSGQRASVVHLCQTGPPFYLVSGVDALCPGSGGAAGYGVTVVLAGTFVIGIPVGTLIGAAYLQRLLHLPAEAQGWLVAAILVVTTLVNLRGVLWASRINTASVIALLALVILVVLTNIEFGAVGLAEVGASGHWSDCRQLSRRLERVRLTLLGLSRLGEFKFRPGRVPESKRVSPWYSR